MKLTGLVALAIFFLSALSVFLEDAFTKNWVVHNYGLIVNYQLTNSSDLIGATDLNQLIKFSLDYDKEDAKLSWKLDVPFEFEYIVNGDIIVTYDKQNVYLWDASTGAVIRLDKMPVKSVHKAFEGFLVLSTDGLHYIDRDSSTLVPGTEGIGAIIVSKLNGVVRIITDSMAFLKLNKDMTLEIETLNAGFQFSKIVDFCCNTLLLSDGTYDISSMNYVTKGKDLKIFHDKVSYSFAKGNFQLFNSGKTVLNDKFESFKFVGNQIIVDESNERKVIDLTKFMDTFDESSIYLDTYNSTGFDREYSFDSVIYSVAVDETISIAVFEPLKDVAKRYNFKLLNYKLAFPKALLINKPESEQTLESIQHLIDEVEQNDVVTRWLKRTKRHMVEIAKYSLSFITKVKYDKVSISNPYNLEKLLIYVDDSSLVAVDSLDGETVWEQAINSVGLVDLQEQEDSIDLVYENEVVTLNPRDGSVLEIKPVSVSYSPELTYLRQTGDALQSYKYVNDALQPTWKFQNSGKIIKVQLKPAHPHASIGVPLHDKSVFYKYLNDDLITVITEDQSITVTLLDGTLGAVVYSVEHDPKDVIDLKSINLIMDDNWVIYSYFVKSPKYEQRITVIDLFKTQLPKKSLKNSVNEPQISPFIKTYIYPVKIVDMASTYTKMGITLKSIIILTESGDLVEIPKFIINSRRIDDKVLSQDDLKDDFRMSPYEPIIPANNYQVLNHQHMLGLDEKNVILVKDTKLESTSIICFINSQNKFCTRVQPSLSFDILSESFDKFKLLITIVILIVGYFITKPMVTKKNLNNRWIDNPL